MIFDLLVHIYIFQNLKKKRKGYCNIGYRYAILKYTSLISILMKANVKRKILSCNRMRFKIESITILIRLYMLHQIHVFVSFYYP